MKDVNGGKIESCHATLKAEAKNCRRFRRAKANHMQVELQPMVTTQPAPPMLHFAKGPVLVRVDTSHCTHRLSLHAGIDFSTSSAPMSAIPHRIVKVGIIGCGEIVQVAHIPTFNFLSDHFTITYLCDVSPESLAHSAQKIVNHTPKTTQDPAELCASPEVDLVFIASSDEYHASHVVAGLERNKNVFVEKPMALCLRDADAIIAAEERSKGKVMVGYMRRYATAFLDTVKEIGGMDKILYARVRGNVHSLACK
jgi:hypothetical protein